MNKTFFFVLLLFFSLSGMSQDTLKLSPNNNTGIGQPDVVIKGEDLKNFPGGSLTEILLGRLPGLNQQRTMVRGFDLVFVVDGMVWDNIDAINIYNIDEIAYYRGGLSGKFGVRNTGSSMVFIRTKTAGFNQAFSADVNALAGLTFLKDDSKGKHNYPQSYNVILSQGNDKFAWRGSATYRNSYLYSEKTDRDRQFQLNGDLRYQPAKWLSFGLNLNYAPASAEINTVRPFRSNGSHQQEDKMDRDNWNGFFTAAIKPAKGLVNEFSILKSRIKDGNDSYSKLLSEAPTTAVYIEDSEDLKVRNFSIMNNLNYTFSLDEDKIKVKIAGIYQFERIKNDVDLFTVSRNLINSALISSSGSYETRTSKLNSLTGDLSINLYDVLLLQTGIRRDAYESSVFRPVDKKSLYAPYYSARLSLKHAFGWKDVAVSQLDLFSSLGQYRAPVGVSDGMGDFLYQLLDPNLSKMKMQNYGVNVAFLENRIRLSADWFRNDTYSYLNMAAAPGSNPQGIKLLGAVKTEGWRIWSSAEILRNTPFKWNAGLSVYRNRTSFTSRSGSDFVFNDDGKNNRPIQFGMQHQFSYGNVSLNINGYAYFKQPEIFLNVNGAPGSFVEQKKTGYINLNFLSLGYNFNSTAPGRTFKEFKVSVIGRNLVQHRKEMTLGEMPRTVGLAISTRL